ncbi:DUF3086 domain-containing protein [Prochlorococcus sp. MIT 1223]|uniref:DUF3086 domain-containing protein n=1 Tax=Prochlorococcus sp. MIT 1223 TaxID=3096217 RepID=UPI002A74D82C|nr:DUF3086 domain-containing protein [Prochlorococcus sp. MIT 1223]
MKETNPPETQKNVSKTSSEEEVIKTNKSEVEQIVEPIKKNNQNSSTIAISNKGNQSEQKITSIVSIALEEIKKNRDILKEEVKELTERKSQIEKELQSSFIGQSDAIARRLKGFQDYLTGAFQDLAQSAEQLELVVQPVVLKPSPLDETTKTTSDEITEITPAIADTFKPDEELIRNYLDQFLDQPDFYADPWKFRRSLDPKDINLLSDWFFNLGGRGAQPSRGNRSKNVLVTAALISILGELYGDRFQTLVLASQPERLGEWRRGLQDALGLAREDFGPNSGIMLFERGDGLIEKADRLEERDEVPLIIIDAAEKIVDIPILQFPIWLAFAATAEELYEEEDFI